MNIPLIPCPHCTENLANNNLLNYEKTITLITFTPHGIEHGDEYIDEWLGYRCNACMNPITDSRTLDLIWEVEFGWHEDEETDPDRFTTV